MKLNIQQLYSVLKFSANIYGMNRIVRIMPTYLNMRYIYGINLIAAKGFVSNEFVPMYYLFIFYF